MRTIMFVLLLALVAGAAMAGDYVPADNQQVSVTTAVTATTVAATQQVEVTVPVTSVVEVRHPLTSEDIEYLATVPETDGLRERVRQLMLAGIHHRPACGKWQSGDGAHIDAMYQVWTGPYQARVQIPVPQVVQPAPLPPFPALCPVKPTSPVELEAINLDLLPVGKPAPCMPVCKPAREPRSFTIERAGGSREHTIGGVWHSWSNSTTREEEESPYCPPGGGDDIVPPPVPGPGDTHDPSQPGIVEPPINDPNRPPDQNHGTAGQPWEPFPDGPHQADPVNPPAGGGT